jgi:phenylacetic acid degradation operon negative regulatory protein
MAAMRKLLHVSDLQKRRPKRRIDVHYRGPDGVLGLSSGRLPLVNARAALFDLYGDHLRTRGGKAPISGLIRALGTLEIAPPAVRTAVSRMVAQGWLDASRADGTPTYALTDRAVARLDEAAERIYRTREESWDGRWHLIVLPRITDRSKRERVRVGLRYLGYGAIDDSTWLAAHPSAELAALETTESISVDGFMASHDADTRDLIGRVWDLPALAAAYDEWVATARGIVAGVGPSVRDDRAFAARSLLLHEWRKFLFTDPQLPSELLPRQWPGRAAAEFFDSHAERLLPAAARFVTEILNPDSHK